MKTKSKRREILLTVLAGACLCIHHTEAANILVGAGSSTSYLVLQSPNLGVRTYEVRYEFNSGAPQDTYFLLTQVFASDPGYSSTIFNFGTALAPNYFVNSISYSSVTETGVSVAPFEPYWAHWVAGGEAGFPTSSLVAPATWSEGSGISSPYRKITPGSWDSLFYSDGRTAPSVVPVPETSSTLLLAAGMLLIVKRRRKH
jgi:hypothetical protein